MVTWQDMSPSISFVQSRCMCFSEKCLRSVINFEAEREFRNVLWNKTRFKNFMFARVSKLCYRSKHKAAGKLLDDVHRYDTASITEKVLSKVSMSMGYEGLHDFMENERSETKPRLHMKDGIGDFDISLACKQFPSIIFGHSLPVKLYDDKAYLSVRNDILSSEICETVLSNSTHAQWIDPEGPCETWPSPILCLPNTNSLLLPEETGTWTDEIESVSESSKLDKLDVEQDTTYVELVLDKSISCIDGLSKRHIGQLQNCGFHTLRKLLHHFPRTYADLQNAQSGIDDGQYMIFFGKILSSRAIRASYSLSFLEVVVGCEVADGELTSEDVDETNHRCHKICLHLKKFFRGTRYTSQPFLKSIQQKQKEGDIVCVSGKVRTMSKQDHYEMREYNMDIIEDQQASPDQAVGRPYPVYPSKGGLKPDLLRDIISRALNSLPFNLDPIPEDITRDFGLLRLHDAYHGIHQPKDFNEADIARRRLMFDEFFYLQLARLFQMLEGLGSQIEKAGLLDKYRKPELNAIHFEDWSCLTKSLMKALPYSLTPSQLSAVSEIIWDLKRPVPMNRLLQGDVGCGKTVVAFLACMEVIGSGYQAAFMVPTELLAVQHYEHILDLLENMETVPCKPTVALLTGSTSAKQSRLIRQGLQDGDISMVIGTHSLIADKVEFSTLRIAVVDEQHRFGVIQRGRFNSKLYYNTVTSRIAASVSDGSSEGDVHMAPHVLALSATPIPRTLALALHGDMSLTQITDLPPGRLPVETCIVEGNESGFERVYQMMEDELRIGGKVYLVYPVIEQSEQLPQLRGAAAEFDTISNRFKEYNCGLLHGKMKSDEKDDALRKFRSSELHILVSTLVIESGVDVPDASMMVVANAERFGIAQLHQLRGRVGRGERKSKCVLLGSTTSSLSRLKVLEKSSDGFRLANMDLVLRGPGDLLGKKQSGHLPEFPIARLEIDGNILQEAHLAALKILGMSHDLCKFPELKAELSMRQPLSLLGD